MRRRTFLLGAGNAALFGTAAWTLARRARRAPVAPEVVFPGMREGHALRDHLVLPAPRDERRIGVAILGSGVAGLSCAWALARAGRRDFVLVEGPEVNGNAAGRDLGGPSAEDDLRCPLGAHYLPLPSSESTHVRALLADVGLLLAGEHTATPYYDEAALAHAPRERLLRNGRWESDLLPTQGVSAPDLHQQQRFFAEMALLRTRRGRDGRRLFALPRMLSSTDAEWRALDRETFSHWLDRHGYQAPELRRYLDYCCRDDYGAGTTVVSAWAGLHYFAGRDGAAANASHDAVLTWPGGLSALMQRMRASIDARLGHTRWRIAGTATQLRENGATVQVDCLHMAGGKLSTTRLRAGNVVSAMPLHVLARAWPELAATGYDASVHAGPHAPWLVSNFLMDGYPQEQPGESLAWDNVVHGGRGLGYVVSTHQLLRVAPAAQTVFTAYQALDRMSPAQARTWMLRASPEELRDEAATDLLQAYGEDLWRRVRRLVITVRGHAMAIPVPGSLDNPRLAALRTLDGRIRIAHADLSGYSVFEEAAWWGVRAAESLA